MSISQPLSTLVFTVTAGVLSLILGAKVKVPSILFFLAFGIMLGPEFADLIQPQIFRDNFPQYISLMVALILFEGGSTLKFSQYREISKILRNLMSIGVVVTLVGVSLAARFLVHMPWDRAILFGAIMIVTGPTVVIPILRRLRVQEKVHNVLKWEAILIDPLGVIIAVVLFEFLVLNSGGMAHSVFLLFGRLVIGGIFGVITGFMMVFCLTQRWLLRSEGKELGGLFVLFLTILSYGLSEFFLTESGLVTVTVAGIYFGNKKFPFHEEIDHFKDQVVRLALAILFVLLASNIPISEAQKISREGCLLIIILIMFIRPLGVLLSSWSDKNLSWKEKSFIAFMAPRGIVSASLASLFAVELHEKNPTGENIFLPLAFFVISGMIVVYTLLAGTIAWITGVREGKLKGVLIIGANSLGLIFGEELRKKSIPVKFIDSNGFHCQKAQKKGFEVFEGSAFDADFLESLDIKGVGSMVALTPNHEANVLSCQVFSKFLPRGRVFRLWDKTDRWESVTAPHFDESAGLPIVEGALMQASNSFWNITDIESKVVELKKLIKDLRVTPENLAGEGITFPLFGIKNGEAIFFSCNQIIPADSEIVYLRVQSR